MADDSPAPVVERLRNCPEPLCDCWPTAEDDTTTEAKIPAKTTRINGDAHRAPGRRVRVELCTLVVVDADLKSRMIVFFREFFERLLTLSPVLLLRRISRNALAFGFLKLCPIPVYRFRAAAERDASRPSSAFTISVMRTANRSSMTTTSPLAILTP